MMISAGKKWPLFLIRAAFLGSLLFFGCLSEIDLDVPEGDHSRIAIRGRLVASETPNIFVKITNVTDFRASDIPEPVLGAQVVLLDGSGHRLDIPMQKDGEYALYIADGAYEVEVKPGNAYQLSVTTPEGKTYLSTLETLHSVPAPVSIGQISQVREVVNEAGNIVEQEFLRFLIDTPVIEPETGNRSLLKWSFHGTFRLTESVLDVPMAPLSRVCYISEDLNLEKVVVFNGREGTQDQLNDLFLLEEPYNYRFYEGYYLTVFQQSLSQKAYQYWKNIGQVADQTGSLLEELPGKVKGNFSNPEDEAEEVFGYFYATQEVWIRYRVQPGQNLVRRLCPNLVQPDDDTVNYVCVDCPRRPNSSLEKPAFWED